MRKSGASILAASLGLATLAMLVGCSNPSSSASPPTNTKSSAKAITGFWLGKEKWVGTITNGNIDVSVPSGTFVGSLTATFTTTGVSVAVGSVNQISGVTTNDFTNPVSYVVAAEDGSTATYLVKVSVSTTDVSDGTAKISLWDPSALVIKLSGQVATLEQGSGMTVNADISGSYTASWSPLVRWYVDGTAISTEYGTTITFGSDLAIGPHSLLAVCEYRDIRHSAGFDFLVQ